MALGQILREARESKGMTIAEAAEATRILFPVIEGLETEDFRRIAAPIYGRGFIKIYAEVLGLDPNPLLNDYAELQAGGGEIKTFNRPEPLLPPKREPVLQQTDSASEQPPVIPLASEPAAEEESPTEADFFLAPEEEPAKPRRRDYSFVPGSHKDQNPGQSQMPEKSWLFSRDRTKPVFSKPVSNPSRPSIRMPKITIPSLRIPQLNFRIPQGLKEKLAGLKYPAMSPLVKKAVVIAATVLGLVLITSGLRLIFKPAQTNIGDEASPQTQQPLPKIHVKALRIPMPDPYID